MKFDPFFAPTSRANRLNTFTRLADGTSSPDTDMIHRTQWDLTTSTFVHKSMPTADFTSALDLFQLDLMRDIEALKSLAQGQHKHISYQGTYNAYVLGALSEDEFVADSEKYVVEPKDGNPVLIAETIVRLRKLLDFDLSPSEIADYLELQEESVQAAVRLITDYFPEKKAPALNSINSGITYDTSR